MQENYVENLAYNFINFKYGNVITI